MEELPISIISIIGKILDIGSDFRTLRLINKNWASELGTSLTYLNFNFSDNKIDIIKNIHENYFFDWFINHIQRFYPCVYHINITFTITDNNISEDCFLYFFDTLIKWCMKTKKNKISLLFENVNSSFIIYTLKILSTKLIILNDYNINKIDISITLKDDEIIEIEKAVEINNIYYKIINNCNIKYLYLNVFNHYNLFISNFCKNIDIIYLNILQSNNDIWFIDLNNIINCKKIIVNLQSFCCIQNCFLATEVYINIDYLNHEMILDLFNIKSRLKYLSLSSLPIYNNWFIEFKEKLYDYLLIHPNKVSIEFNNINDIRMLNLIDAIIPIIDKINLICIKHNDYISAKIINYLFYHDPSIFIYWNNNTEKCLDIFSREECKRLARIYKEVNLVWHFVLNSTF